MGPSKSKRRHARGKRRVRVGGEFPFNPIASRPAYAELPVQRAGSKAARKRRKGPAKRANTLTISALQKVEQVILDKSRSRESDFLKLRLSLRAGLRAGEIAALPIQNMLEADGRIAATIEVFASKTNHTRFIDMHDDIRDALEAVLEQHPAAQFAAFSIAADGTPRYQSASCVANWFHRLYRSANLIGCSSHSGRRTFATDLARLIGAYNGSIKDLQLALGHARLSSTESYLEPSAQLGQMIRSLGK